MGALRLLLADNGALWTFLYVNRSLIQRISIRLDARLEALEQCRDLPGANSRAWNYATWQEWNWERAGEEWTESEEWKDALVNEILYPNITHGSLVLEIGPGAGRWTEKLLEIAGHVTAVDLSDRCIALCKERFRAHTNINYLVNDGRSLKGVDDSSIDTVWSFDVFVHIAPSDIAAYLDEIARVLRPGGVGVIHHADRTPAEPTAAQGWRSRMTAQYFAELAENAGLEIRSQLPSWGPEGQYRLQTHGDVISIFQRPIKTQ